jgi:hypothetical protein
MASNGPLSTPYGSPLVGTPDVGEATTQGSGVSLNENGAAGLQGTPFEKPIAATPGQAPTSNTSGIPNTWTTTGGIPNAPADGSTAAVADGVATPNTPAGNMTGGKDGANIGIGKG